MIKGPESVKLDPSSDAGISRSSVPSTEDSNQIIPNNINISVPQPMVTNIQPFAITANSANQIIADVGNIKILGGSPNTVLRTNGAGTLSWVPYNWNSLIGKPSFAVVATTGNYNDLSNKPVIPNLASIATTTYVNSKVSAIPWSSIANRPALATVASTGNYNDLVNKPTIPSSANLATVSYVDSKFASISANAGANLITTRNLVFSGDITSGSTLRISTSNVSLGSVNNVKILGGGPNNFLKTDGNGTLTWSPLESAATNTVTKNATSYNTIRSTAVSMNNISARVSSNGMPQLSAVAAGNSSVCISSVSLIKATNSSTATTTSSVNATGLALGTWTNAGTTLSSFGDYVTAHVQNTTLGTVHRVTFLQTANLSNASVIIERLV